MNQKEIKEFLRRHEPCRARTIAIIDFGNVEKWKNTLGWAIGVRELATLVKHFSCGARHLRRFYYGADYGPSEKSAVLTEWSAFILQTAKWNGFEVINKRVKYIHTTDNIHGFEKKCDLDVEMAVDLIQECDSYDNIVLFSGDGDLMRAISYLREFHGKRCIIISARGHIGREILDAKAAKIIEEILFADDFEYRLNMNRCRL